MKVDRMTRWLIFGFAGIEAVLLTWSVLHILGRV